MILQPGMRLRSTTCDTEVIVTRAPSRDVDLRCGGSPMVPHDQDAPREQLQPGETPTLLGKRYANEELGLEVLCTKGGAGALTLADEPLHVKGAKPLPASD